MKQYNVIGVMSGTSLDGVDICYCSFTYSDKWSYRIVETLTVNYPIDIITKLRNSINLTGLELTLLNNKLGNFFGETINSFAEEKEINKSDIDFISSHGHTVFHQPDKKLTLQIGNGANISTICQLPVICDFRTTDLALNGNGAPLVPIGDKLLFSEFDCCLNIGGIANISFEQNGNRVAYDICPANMILNHVANKINLDYDKNGEIAKSGRINKELLGKLNNLSYYSRDFPKSLGFEWVSEKIFTLLSDDKEQNILRTLTEHIAEQIGKNIKGNTLVTGGGAHNSFLINRIQHYSNFSIEVPGQELVDFKEALIFGFLGVLRWRNEINILNSVTGSSNNSIGGCIYNPLSN